MQQQGQNPLSIAIPKPPQEPPEKLRIHTILPPQDPHFTEAIEDFLCLFSDADLKREPYIREYVSEELARWGRWTHRGRAPAACFEAACSGAQRHLEKIGHLPTECTSRVDATLAKALAGMIVNAVEPDATDGPIREKAILIVADEFLVRASSPKVSLAAKRRMQKRKTQFLAPDDPVQFTGEAPSAQMSGLQIREVPMGDRFNVPTSASSAEFDNQSAWPVPWSAVSSQEEVGYRKRPSATSDDMPSPHFYRKPSAASDSSAYQGSYSNERGYSEDGISVPFVPPRRPSLPSHLQDIQFNDNQPLFGSTGRKPRGDRSTSHNPNLPVIPASPKVFQSEIPLSYQQQQQQQEPGPSRFNPANSTRSRSVGDNESALQYIPTRKSSREATELGLGSQIPPEQLGYSELLDDVLNECESYLEDLNS